MSYLNETNLKRLVNINKDIILTQKSRVRSICEICFKAKSSRKISKRFQYEIFEKFDKIYMNLRDSFNVSFIDEIKYYIFFIN